MKSFLADEQKRNTCVSAQHFFDSASHLENIDSRGSKKLGLSFIGWMVFVILALHNFNWSHDYCLMDNIDIQVFSLTIMV